MPRRTAPSATGGTTRPGATASSTRARQRLGAFVETLSRFRPDLAVVAVLAEIDGEDDSPPAGKAVASGRFADVGDAGSLATLREALAGRAIHYGVAEIDGAAIRLGAPRAFTQEVSRFVYEWRDANGPFAGIRYLSRLGDEFVNWAIFEPSSAVDSPLEQMEADVIEPHDGDLAEALRLLGLELG